MNTPDTMTLFDRGARILLDQDKFVEAEEVLERPLEFYVAKFDGGAGMFGWVSGAKVLLPIMRLVVEVKRELGKEEEARALELDLDESEAILDSISAAALNEVRDEIRAKIRQHGVVVVVVCGWKWGWG